MSRNTETGGDFMRLEADPGRVLERHQAWKRREEERLLRALGWHGNEAEKSGNA